MSCGCCVALPRGAMGLSAVCNLVFSEPLTYYIKCASFAFNFSCYSYKTCVLIFLVVIRDMFHVYLNKCEFRFSRLLVIKIKFFCFLLNYGRVPCMTK